MSDIKKKFLDILFEPETEEIEAEAPLVDVKVEKPIKEEKVETIDNKEKETVKTPNAKDILYGKQDKPSSFIDYFEVPKVEKYVEEKPETYEMKENVSPIFGPISQKERKKKTASEKDIQKAVTSTSTNEYTGIVLSPIYGYDSGKANDARKTMFGKYIKENQNETNDDLFYDEEPAFDIPDGMSETIKEAVQEAVVELNPSKSVIKEIIEEANEKTQNLEINKIKEEAINESEEENDYVNPIEDFSFEEQEELKPEDTNEYFFEEIKEDETAESFDDTQYEEVEEEKYEEPETVQDSYEEQYEQPESFEDEINASNEFAVEETHEEQIEQTTEIPKQVSEEHPSKATRSIYDTTPIQLFDFDELTEKDTKDDDLFDELIGDDD